MAATSLLLLLDDIAAILDDVALMSKVAAKKTAGVLGDDLALNAQQVAGVKAERELPVVWAVAKGSLVNKAILVPSALAISALASWAITPLLMLGGAFLCYEGVEKFAHKLLHGARDDQTDRRESGDAPAEAAADPVADPVTIEKDKIKGAIRTDFILSAEIIVIALGTVAAASFGKQVVVLSLIALAMTAFVYGLVAGIVKLDDAGLNLLRRDGAGVWPALQRRLGTVLLNAAPLLMKFLAIAGTAAMFLVGGGILVHGIPAVQTAITGVAQRSEAIPGIGWVLDDTLPTLLNGAFGIAAGIVCLLAVLTAKRAALAFKSP